MLFICGEVKIILINCAATGQVVKNYLLMLFYGRNLLNLIFVAVSDS